MPSVLFELKGSSLKPFGIYCVWNAQGASKAGAQLGLDDPRSALAGEIFVTGDNQPKPMNQYQC